MHDGGTSELGTRLRHLLAWLGLLLVGSTLGSFVVAFVQYGSAYWSGPHGLDAVLRWSGMGLLAIACGLLAVGCAGLLGEPEWPRPVLFGGSVVWLAAAIVVLYLFAGQVLRTMPPLRSTSWAIFAREAENWLIASSALPLLLLVFVSWPEVIPAPPIAGRPTGGGLPFPPSSLSTRL